jgi:hypothetical protein
LEIDEFWHEFWDEVWLLVDDELKEALESIDLQKVESGGGGGGTMRFLMCFGREGIVSVKLGDGRM